MAASGTEEANLTAINKGDSRGMIVAKVGRQPDKVVDTPSGRMEIYELEKGNEPSTGRAIAHGSLTLFTLGLWEIIGMPLELIKGEKYFLTAYYNENDELLKYEISPSRPN